MEILEQVKSALRITTDAHDDELDVLIRAGMIDLGMAGVSEDLPATDPIVCRAICTYCKLNFGSPEEYDRLKRAYDEQKKQMGMATGYTDYVE